MTDLVQVFAYADHKIRTVLINNAVFFVLVDLCAALGIGNTYQAAARIDGDWVRQARVIDSRGRGQMTNVVSEPGLYQLIFMSEKPEARKFARWVFESVLPEIRRTGAYNYVDTLLPPDQPATFTLEDSVSLLRQFFHVPVRNVFDLTSLLRDAGLFRQRAAPRSQYEHLFWNAGSSWTVRRVALSEIAYRLNEAYRAIHGAVAELHAPGGVQLALDLNSQRDAR